jgi:hypothetical protein
MHCNLYFCAFYRPIVQHSLFLIQAFTDSSQRRLVILLIQHTDFLSHAVGHLRVPFSPHDEDSLMPTKLCGGIHSRLPRVSQVSMAAVLDLLG